MRVPASCVAALLYASSSAAAQDVGDPLSGVWTGDIVTPSGALTTSFRIEPDGAGGWTGTADTPVQGVFGLPLTSVELGDGGAVVFAMAHARYEAVLSRNPRVLKGHWKQNGREASFDCTWEPAPPPIPDDLSASLPGIWEGVLQVGAVELRIVLTLEKGEDGRLAGHMQSPDQTPARFPLTRVDHLGGRELRFAFGSVPSAFELTLDESGAALAGTMIQGPSHLAIELTKVEQETAVRRPQTPAPPFPYRSEDVTYRNEAGGVTLAGTLTLPEGDAPFPAVLLITGSGAQDRDETIFQHKPFLVIADHLTRAGIAVLRVDDRGVGGSTAGDGPGATSADFAGDVAAGVAFLAERPEIAADRIGLIGHSEGGVIAPMVARDTEAVAFIVLLAGTGVRGDVLLSTQNEAIARASGVEGEELEAALRTQRELFAIALDTSLSPEAARGKMKAMIEAAAREAGEDPSEAELAVAVEQLESPWLCWFLRHDPAPVLEEVGCPVLAINGTLDLQVPWKANLDAIRTALEKGGNPDATVRELPGLNHLFQHAETGLMAEYGKIEETFAPEVLTLISDWIKRRFLGPRGGRG